MQVVHVLSTSHGDAERETGQGDRRVLKPTCVIDYNRCMGGIDLIDQQLHQVQALRKSYKWYKKVVFRLILQCVLASHKLYKIRGGQQDFQCFLHGVITQLIAKAPRFVKNPAAPLDNIIRLTGREHFPCKREYEGGGSKMSSKVKRCRVCYARGILSASGRPVRTTWICSACPSEPGLCIERDCFDVYHTKIDYSS